MADFTWTQPLVNTDGSVFDETQFNGYEIEVDGAPAVSIPAAWAADGEYTFPVASVVTSSGAHSARIRVGNTDGTFSDYSNSASFSITRTPEAPTNFSVA